MLSNSAGGTVGVKVSCVELEDGARPVTLESLILDEFLLPIDKAEEPFRISCHNVSCFQPSIGGYCFSGCSLVVEVPLMDEIIRHGALRTFSVICTFVTLGPRSQSSPVELSPWGTSFPSSPTSLASIFGKRTPTEPISWGFSPSPIKRAPPEISVNPYPDR